MYTGGIFEGKKEIPVYYPFASEARREEGASRDEVHRGGATSFH